MRCIVVGLGVQGEKRAICAGKDYVSSVDPVNPKADFKKIQDVPLIAYDAALVCVPDNQKFHIIKYLIKNQKHILIEKPLLTNNLNMIKNIEKMAKQMKVVCYTAYNHRFEPHYIRMKKLITSGKLGKIYSCRMFYGNGTARLVKNSKWRDKDQGVLTDLGSHLLDTTKFWWDDIGEKFKFYSKNCFENRSPDHVIIGSEESSPRIELEMSLVMWRNHFTCDVLAEKGSAHISSLCKWGPPTFVYRKRVLPSGKPIERKITLKKKDPTWILEYEYFKNICKKSQKTDLSRDYWILKVLQKIQRGK